MKILRTAVLGLGRIGWQYHVPQVLNHSGFQLVAVADPLQERLEEARVMFGLKGYQSPEELIASEALDLVVVASPTRFHTEQTLAAFARGFDVFCDKPMAPTLEEADRMIAGMKEYGRKLMIYQPHRVVSEAVALREILKRDLIGPIYMMKRGRSAYARRNDWQAFRKHGGGMLNNYGAHYIDQLLYVAGARAQEVFCTLHCIASLGDADDVVKMVIITDKGTVLDLDINMASAYPIQPWLVLGQRGSANYDEEKRAWQVRWFDPKELADVPLVEALAAPNRRYGSGETIPWKEESFPLADYPPQDFYSKVYQYYALDRPPFVPIEDSREVMRVLGECRACSDRLLPPTSGSDDGDE